MVAFVVPMGLAAARAAAPYAMRYGAKPAGKAIKYGLGAIKNYFRPGSKIVKVPAPTTGTGKAFFKVPSRNAPAPFQNRPMFSIGGRNPANIASQVGITGAMVGPGLYESYFGEEKIDEIPSEERPKNSAQKPKKKTDSVITDFDKKLKKGDLDSLIAEKIDVFEKYLGKDTEKRKKGAGYNAMIEFGLNLASARGGNLVDKISRSAKDPMAKFASVGEKILERAEKIKMAGVEAGIKASEREADREITKEGYQVEKEIQQMKNDASKLDKNEWMRKYSAELLTNPEALKQISKPYLQTSKGDNKGKYGYMDGDKFIEITQSDIVRSQLEQIWGAGSGESESNSGGGSYTEIDITEAMESNNMSRDEVITEFEKRGYTAG